MSNYITPNELRAIADICDSLDPLWDALVSIKGGVSIALEDLTINCYDANGETLGYISWGDEKAAFYANTDKD